MKRFPVQAFFIAAAVSVCASFSAFATEVSNPAGDWVVGPIEAKGAAGERAAYCSMKNAYDDKKILVFARDVMESNSIALDFQKKRFDAGRQYHVRFGIPPMQRDMIGIAATPKVLIMQMGHDQPFYDMLGRKNVLHVGIGGNKPEAFAFSLNGTSDALGALDACTKNLLTGEPFKQVSIPASENAPFVPGEDDVAFDPPIGDQVKVEAPPKPDSVTKTALSRSLMDEIENLRLENRKLLLELQSKEVRADIEDNVTDEEWERALLNEKQRLEKALSAAQEQIALQEGLTQRMTGMAENNVLLERKVAEAEIRAEAALKEIALKEAALREISLSKIEPAGGERASIMAVQPAVLSSSKDVLRDLLVAAHVATQEGIEAKTKETGLKAYRWETEEVFGAAEESDWPKNMTFAEMVEDFMTRSSDLCKGDFAYTIGKAGKISGIETVEAEMACLDGENDAAAALVFIGDRQEDTFAIVTHEGTADQIGIALGKRDSVLSVLSK